MSLTIAAQEAIWLNSLLAELAQLQSQMEPIILHEDNYLAI